MTSSSAHPVLVVPVGNELIQLLNQPLHILLPLINVRPQTLKVLFLHLKLLGAVGDVLEHGGEGRIDPVHPAGHVVEPGLVAAPLLRDLFQPITSRVID